MPFSSLCFELTKTRRVRSPDIDCVHRSMSPFGLRTLKINMSLRDQEATENLFPPDASRVAKRGTSTPVPSEARRNGFDPPRRAELKTTCLPSGDHTGS